MNRFITTAAILLAGLPAFLATPAKAQQTLWDFGSMNSPEINANGSVTFRFLAPWASEVKITGDFLPAGQSEAQMLQDAGGVWYFTSEPLESELYTYRILLDDVPVRDVQSTYTQRDVSSIMNYFIIPGDRGNLYSIKDVPHGNISRNWYSSSVLKQQRRVTIYTPPGYEKSDKRYPVLYLLHGMGGDEEAWLCTGRAAQILDNMIAAHRCPPMIVVMPNGNTRHKSAPGESDEGYWQPYMTGSFDTSFEAHFKDVVNYVDRSYRTISKASGRAVAGLSMGGWHSWQIGLNYPWLFNYVGLFSAAVDAYDKSDPSTRMFPSIYEGTDEKIDELFEDKAKHLYIAIGRDDFLYDDNKALREQLDAKGYSYRYFETDGGHVWRNWRKYLEDYLTTIFK